VIGTINFDYRSLVHHYEDAVWMYNTPTVADAKAAFEDTLTLSKKMNKKSAKLSLSDKLVKSINKLFAPLLSH
jgi:cardiolipin synthase